MENEYCYFRMKVGQGNCLFHYAISNYDPTFSNDIINIENKASEGDKYHFFLGFDRGATETVCYNGNENYCSI